MKLIPLPAMTREQTGFTHKAIVTYVDVAALGAVANGVIQVFPTTGDVPVGTLVGHCAFNVITAFDFSDAGITSMLAELGDDGDTDRFVKQTEVAVDGTEVLYKGAAMDTAPYAYVAANGIDLKVTVANGGSPLCSECTSGEMEVYLRVGDLNDLERAQ